MYKSKREREWLRSRMTPGGEKTFINRRTFIRLHENHDNGLILLNQAALPKCLGGALLVSLEGLNSMHLYENSFFGVRMEIPDGWETEFGSEEGLEEFQRDAALWKPVDPTIICFHATRTLVSARLIGPKGRAGSDASIDFQACVQTDECFLNPHHGRPPETMDLNGIQILYNDSFNELSPENIYYRFIKWKVSKNLWLYASVYAYGKARFECALSVFETLAPLASAPLTKKQRLFEQEPWNIAPTLFAMQPIIDDDGPFYDLDFESEVSKESLIMNRGILSGRYSDPGQEWTPLQMREVVEGSNADCYHGPGGIHSSGVFSSRAIDLLRPYLASGFSLLPCTVDRKPYYFLAFQSTETRLDLINSELRRFEDGTIRGVERYRFKEDDVIDPLVFSIAEDCKTVFVTASIPSLVAKAGLTGIRFFPVNGNGRDYAFPESAG